ncbi:hypothetical protein BST61_g9535 [Cercospora zeina]
MRLLQLLLPIILAATPALAKSRTGGECSSQGDCCICDPVTQCLLGCYPDTTSTTGYSCRNDGPDNCGVISGCVC